jgi:hypothetical protein
MIGGDPARPSERLAREVAPLLTYPLALRIGSDQGQVRNAMEHGGTHAESHPAKPRDARSFALVLIGRFGERAMSYATHQSLKAGARGDARNAARWRWIAEITRNVLRSDPGESAEP